MTQQKPTPQYIAGTWTAEAGSDTFESRNPATGAVAETVQRGTSSDVERAVEAAREAFPDWRDRSTIGRAEILWNVYDALRDRHEELAQTVTRECGKEISEGRADVTEAWHMVEWAAGNARHPHGDVVPSEIPSKDASMRRTPRGVVGSITPWNFPIAIPFWHLAITLVEGNTVVWKPAEQTPACGRVIAELFDEAGIPDGVFNMVQGFGETGAAIVAHDEVDTIVFTGSAEVGQGIARDVAADPSKSATCEMGGKNAIVVTENADLDIALHSAVMSSFKTTGQRCVSSERLLVHDGVYEQFRERFVDLAEDVAVGDPLEESTFMGPVVDADQVAKITEYNQLVRDSDEATVLVDREQLPDEEIPDGHGAGNWIGPFVYETDPEADLRAIREEVFGPHVALLRYDGDIDRAIEHHNDTAYGLAGAIISEDYRELNRFRDHAELGLAYANLPCIGAEIQLPFGGVKKSGAGFPYARELIESVTDRTAWTLNNDSDIQMAQGLSAEIQTRED
jgi:aldehyde dehydrogenase (NAD+)